MKIFLLGATGSTGYEILKRLVAENHSIKLLVRNPSKLSLAELKPATNQVEIIQGEVFESEKLTQHFKDSDIIISALGTGKDNLYTEIYSAGGRNMLNAMRLNNIRKLITITSGLIDMSDPSTDNFFLNRIIRPTITRYITTKPAGKRSWMTRKILIGFVFALPTWSTNPLRENTESI